MKKIIALFLVCSILAACQSQDKVLQVGFGQLLNGNSLNRTVYWLVTDDLSKTINGTLYIDTTLKWQGTMQNNTLVEFNVLLDPNIKSRTIALKATDESGNTAWGNITVTLDTESPVIQRLEIR